MTNIVQVAGNQGDNAVNTDRRPSPFLWNNCPWDTLLDGTTEGVYEYCDFNSGGLITSPTTEAALVGLPLNGFGSSGSTFTYDSARNGGGGIVLTEATQSEGAILRSLGACLTISADAGDLWCEARLKISSVTTNVMALIFGLMDTTAASATIPLTMTSGAVADCNFVGFHKPVANTTALDTSYKANGVTLVEVNSDVGTLAAATYIKLGFYFKASTANLSFYINGIKQAATKTVPSNTGTDFPADVALGLVAGFCLGSGATSSTLTIDWWRVAQLAA